MALYNSVIAYGLPQATPAAIVAAQNNAANDFFAGVRVPNYEPENTETQNRPETGSGTYNNARLNALRRWNRAIIQGNKRAASLYAQMAPKWAKPMFSLEQGLPNWREAIHNSAPQSRYNTGPGGHGGATAIGNSDAMAYLFMNAFKSLNDMGVRVNAQQQQLDRDISSIVGEIQSQAPGGLDRISRALSQIQGDRRSSRAMSGAAAQDMMMQNPVSNEQQFAQGTYAMPTTVPGTLNNAMQTLSPYERFVRNNEERKSQMQSPIAEADEDQEMSSARPQYKPLFQTYRGRRRVVGNSNMESEQEIRGRTGAPLFRLENQARIVREQIQRASHADPDYRPGSFDEQAAINALFEPEGGRTIEEVAKTTQNTAAIFGNQPSLPKDAPIATTSEEYPNDVPDETIQQTDPRLKQQQQQQQQQQRQPTQNIDDAIAAQMIDTVGELAQQNVNESQTEQIKSTPQQVMFGVPGGSAQMLPPPQVPSLAGGSTGPGTSAMPTPTQEALIARRQNRVGNEPIPASQEEEKEVAVLPQLGKPPVSLLSYNADVDLAHGINSFMDRQTEFLKTGRQPELGNMTYNYDRLQGTNDINEMRQQRMAELLSGKYDFERDDSYLFRGDINSFLRTNIMRDRLGQDREQVLDNVRKYYIDTYEPESQRQQRDLEKRFKHALFTSRGSDAQFYNNDIFSFDREFNLKPSKEMISNIDFYNKIFGGGDLQYSIGLIEKNIKKAQANQQYEGFHIFDSPNEEARTLIDSMPKDARDSTIAHLRNIDKKLLFAKLAQEGDSQKGGVSRINDISTFDKRRAILQQLVDYRVREYNALKAEKDAEKAKADEERRKNDVVPSKFKPKAVPHRKKK